MKKLWIFLGGLAAGLIIMGLSYEYHFVMSDDGFLFVPKSQASLKDVYVDIREWTISDWGDHPQVAKALIADGRDDLVTTSITEGALQEVLPGLGEEPEVANPFHLNRQ